MPVAPADLPANLAEISVDLEPQKGYDQIEVRRGVL